MCDARARGQRSSATKTPCTLAHELVAQYKYKLLVIWLFCINFMVHLLAIDRNRTCRTYWHDATLLRLSALCVRHRRYSASDCICTRMCVCVFVVMCTRIYLRAARLMTSRPLWQHTLYAYNESLVCIEWRCTMRSRSRSLPSQRVVCTYHDRRN